MKTKPTPTPAQGTAHTPMASHSPIPGPFRSIGSTVEAISHGQWFAVVRCDNPRFTPESKWAMAAHVAHCLDSHASNLAKIEALTKALEDALEIINADEAGTYTELYTRDVQTQARAALTAAQS